MSTMYKLKLAYWYFETYVLIPIVGSKAMRALDFVAGSECKYCMTTRGIFLGVAATHLAYGRWELALAWTALPLGLTAAERFLGAPHEPE